MTAPHCIRLRGPWEYHSQTTSGKITLPGDWLATLPKEICGDICFTRRFHTPSGLNAHTRIALVASGLPEQAVLRLNQTTLSSAANNDVTALLRSQNVLEVSLTLPLDGPLVAEVWLEIRE